MPPTEMMDDKPKKPDCSEGMLTDRLKGVKATPACIEAGPEGT